MSNGKQPLEGLTVRIWDPPSNSTDKKAEDQLSKGSRGYRQYTEQVGSDKLKYSTHDWDDKPKKATGLKKSARDWDAEKKKLESVQDLPLVSRSDPQTDNQSLRNVKLQHDLWDHIMKKISEIKNNDDKKEWEPIVILFRKLREGVYASGWSNGDYPFAIHVFERSVNCSIMAHNYEELVKSLSGLINELYVIKKDAEKSYYTVVDIMYHCCYIQNSKMAMNRVTSLKADTTNEGIFGKRLVKCVFHSENPIRYFQLYYNNPYPTFKILMSNYNDTMRIKAIDVLRKAYLSASIEWVGKWLGVKNDNKMVVSIIERLVPSCIKSVDYDRQLIYFLKKKKI